MPLVFIPIAIHRHGTAAGRHHNGRRRLRRRRRLRCFPPTCFSNSWEVSFPNSKMRMAGNHLIFFSCDGDVDAFRLYIKHL